MSDRYGGIDANHDSMVVDQKMKKQKMVQDEDSKLDKFFELIWGRSSIGFDELKKCLGVGEDYIDVIETLLDIENDIYERRCQGYDMKIRFDIDELNRCIHVRENSGSGVVKDVEEIEEVLLELKKRVRSMINL